MTCDFCGLALPARVLVCPCGRLSYGKRIAALAREAEALEASQPGAARDLWAEALSLLPETGDQARQIRIRIGTLSNARPANKTLIGAGTALGVLALKAKTFLLLALKAGKLLPMVLSMAVSVFFYAQIFRVPYAVGLVGLIWIHEMGHVLAFWLYKIPVQGVFFIPFFGAVTRGRAPGRTVVENAWIALGGPLLGSAGAAALLLVGYQQESSLLVALGQAGLLLNLVNLIPVAILDGAQVALVLDLPLWIAGTVVVSTAGYLVGEPYVGLLALLTLPAVLGNRDARRRGTAFHRASFLQRLGPAALHVSLVAALVAANAQVSARLGTFLKEQGHDASAAAVSSLLDAEAPVTSDR